MADIPVVDDDTLPKEQPEISEAQSSESGGLGLDFPQIPLHLSLESLLTLSASSGSFPTTPKMSARAGPPSLDESWTSLTDLESSNEDDLQSEHTDVASLLDTRSTDEALSVMGGANGEGTDDVASVENDVAEEQEQPQQLMTMSFQNVSDSTATSITSAQIIDPESVGAAINPDPVAYQTAVQPLSELDMQKLRQNYRDGAGSMQYASVIRLMLLETGLDLNALDYFKVVLLGRHVEQFRPEIQRKLGDALVSRKNVMASNNRSSVARFHLVPNAFGPGAEPEFADLVAIDKQIEFDCYDTVEMPVTDDVWPPLILKNTQTRTQIVSKWEDRQFVVDKPRWIRPDLAIVCIHLDDKDEVDDESRGMLAFAQRHGIPTILIRMDRGHHGRYLSSVTGLGTLHECVQTLPKDHGLHSESHRVIRRLPIDLAAFLNLDLAVLNKHIAYATSPAYHSLVLDMAHPKAISVKASSPPSAAFHRSRRDNRPFGRSLYITLCIIGLCVFLGSHLWAPFPLKPGLQGRDRVQMAEEACETLTKSTAGTTSLFSSTTSSSIIGAAANKETAAGSNFLAVGPLMSTPSLGEDALHFQVGIAGESQLMVKLPTVALARKKRSSLSVALKRANRTIPTTVQKLFDGVFSVQLPPHETYGTVEVELAMTKPKLAESFNVTFGDRPYFGVQSLHGAFVAINAKLQKPVDFVAKHVQESLHKWALENAKNNLQMRQRQALIAVSTFWSDSKNWTRTYPLAAARAQQSVAKFLQPYYHRAAALSGRSFTQADALLDRLTHKIAIARSAMTSVPTSAHPLNYRNWDGRFIAQNLAIAQDRLRQGRAHAEITFETARRHVQVVTANAKAKLTSRRKNA